MAQRMDRSAGSINSTCATSVSREDRLAAFHNPLHAVSRMEHAPRRNTCLVILASDRPGLAAIGCVPAPDRANVRF
jgi:hypothetical protein